MSHGSGHHLHSTLSRVTTGPKIGRIKLQCSPARHQVNAPSPRYGPMKRKRLKASVPSSLSQSKPINTGSCPGQRVIGSSQWTSLVPSPTHILDECAPPAIVSLHSKL